jgi:hypothetical protein
MKLGVELISSPLLDITTNFSIAFERLICPLCCPFHCTMFDRSMVLLLAPVGAAPFSTPLFLHCLNTQSQNQSPSNVVGRFNTSSNSFRHFTLTGLSLFPNSSLFQSAFKTMPLRCSIFRAPDVYQFRNHRMQKGSYNDKSS